MFTPGSPLTLANTSYERVSLLLNIAALYCQLGTAEDRSTIDGIKRAVAYFTVLEICLSAHAFEELNCRRKGLVPYRT